MKQLPTVTTAVIVALLMAFRGQALEMGEECYKAVFQLRAEAMLGNARAQGRLGAAYLTGKGVPQDSSEAIKWYRKSAEQGIADSQFDLGVIYYSGLGVPRSAIEAEKWWQRAAAQGSTTAQLNIGLAFSSGDGVKKDYILADKWCTLASTSGIGPDSERAAKCRTAVQLEMSPADIAKAHQLVQVWRAMPEAH